MLLRFFKVESAVIEMIMFFGLPFSIGFFSSVLDSSGISPPTICCRWFCPHLHLIPVWLNSPFPIITKQLSKIFSNTERREVVFRTQWFIGQYCSEREGRGYRCRCTSAPLSLYFISILWRLVMTAFHRWPKRKRFFPFLNNHRRPRKVLFCSIFTTLFLTFFPL